MTPKINKKIIIGMAIAAVLVFGLIIGWVILQKEKAPEEETVTETERELKELEELRKETPALTEERIEEQVEELEKLRQETQPLSEEEIQKQLEELEKLRQL